MSNVLKSMGKMVARLLIENQSAAVAARAMRASRSMPGGAIRHALTWGGGVRARPSLPPCVTPCGISGPMEGLE